MLAWLGGQPHVAAATRRSAGLGGDLDYFGAARAARTAADGAMVLPDIDRRAVRGLKFSAALPERLAVATVAARLADFAGASAVLAEPVRLHVSQR